MPSSQNALFLLDGLEELYFHRCNRTCYDGFYTSDLFLYVSRPKKILKDHKDHKRLDNCDLLKKYAGIEIGYILETRPEPGK